MTPETLMSVVDILLVSFINYRILVLIRGPRAWRMVVGALVFVLLLLFSKIVHLFAVEFILEKALVLAPVAVVILLLPELRRALEGFGKLGAWGPRIAAFENASEYKTVDQIVEACSVLATQHVGALIVIERGAPLSEIEENGVPVDAKITAALLESIFYEGNPLHDGAAIIRGDRVVCAACRLPFSENPELSKSLHMRHRAAVGITEVRDCVAIVVSEERGTISYVSEGNLRRVSPDELRDLLVGERRPEWTKRWSLLHRKPPRPIPKKEDANAPAGQG